MVERDAPVVDARNARGVPPPVPPRIFVQLENAYLRRRTVEESRVVELLTVREDMPYIETIELPWGAKLIPDDELERLAAERRRTARPRQEPATRDRKPALPPEIAKRIHHERSA